MHRLRHAWACRFLFRSILLSRITQKPSGRQLFAAAHHLQWHGPERSAVVSPVHVEMSGERPAVSLGIRVICCDPR
jgi:hypothetical protein